jgi:hypothetical protein
VPRYVRNFALARRLALIWLSAPTKLNHCIAQLGRQWLESNSLGSNNQFDREEVSLLAAEVESLAYTTVVKSMIVFDHAKLWYSDFGSILIISDVIVTCL